MLPIPAVLMVIQLCRKDSWFDSFSMHSTTMFAPSGHCVTVYWDAHSLVTGENWEDGHASGLLKSLCAFPLLSFGSTAPLATLELPVSGAFPCSAVLNSHNHPSQQSVLVVMHFYFL